MNFMKLIVYTTEYINPGPLPFMMEYSISNHGVATVIRPLFGAYTLRSEPATSFAELIASLPGPYILHVENVHRWDTHGLGCLAEAYKLAASKEQRLVVAGVDRRLREKFETTQFSRFLTVHDSLDDALMEFS